MNHFRSKVVMFSLLFLSFQFIGMSVGIATRTVPRTDDKSNSSALTQHEAKTMNVEASIRNSKVQSNLPLLVNDDALEQQQQPLAEIWQLYLISYEAKNKTAERLDEEELQKNLLLAKDTGKEIDSEIHLLAPILPTDYTGHYLGREKFTIVLSSFENLEFYQSLFHDLSLVEFKQADFAYLELYTIAQEFSATIPATQVTVNSVLGRITLSILNDPTAMTSAETAINSSELFAQYKDYIDIEIVEAIQTFTPKT